MKVILSVPDEGYFERTWWRLFQKRVVRTKFDIYFLITENMFPYLTLFVYWFFFGQILPSGSFCRTIITGAARTNTCFVTVYSN
jgi:hypothetical protein